MINDIFDMIQEVYTSRIEWIMVDISFKLTKMVHEALITSLLHVTKK